MPSTTSRSAAISVMSGAAANISGSAPETSASARRLRSPATCAGNLFSMRWALAITPTTGFFIRCPHPPDCSKTASCLPRHAGSILRLHDALQRHQATDASRASRCAPPARNLAVRQRQTGAPGRLDPERIWLKSVRDKPADGNQLATSSNERLRARNDLAWAIAVGGIGIVLFAGLL